jgi:hypothetical protein
MPLTPTAGPQAMPLPKVGFQIGIDTAEIVLKEFWPDLERKLHRRK